MNKLTKWLIAAGFSTALLLAQGPRGGFGGGGGTPPDPATMVARRVDGLAKRLTLTDAQKAGATTIFTNAMSAEQNLHTSLRSTSTSLADAVKKNDVASIDQLSSTLGTLTGQLTAISRKADAAFYALLNPDQQTKYDSMPYMGGGGGGFPGPQGRFRGSRGGNNQ